MRDFHVRLIRFFALIIAAPFLVGLINAFFPGAGFVLFLFGTPVLAIVLIAGVIRGLILGIKEYREAEGSRGRVLAILASPLLAAITVLLAWPALVVGGRLGDLSRLALNQGHYEDIIEKARIGGKSAWYKEDEGVTYSVDAGPPIRVAFNPAGMLDNWSGIIFDPTGIVMQADGFDPKTGKFHAPERVTKLFGGDLVSCRHLWGDYYSCSFT